MSRQNNVVYLETLVSMYTIDKGKIKILLLKNKEEKYKGYWILPGNLLNKDETLEDSVAETIIKETGIMDVDVEQYYTFSNLDRNTNNRLLATVFVGLIDSKRAELKRVETKDYETAWFDVDNLPKIGYDHEDIIKKCNEYVERKLLNTNVLKELFPSDFTLPELQQIYEQILNKKIDRRNFRKKFINLDLIEDTDEYNIGFNGRPAKLYRFKEDIREMNLF